MMKNLKEFVFICVFVLLLTLIVNTFFTDILTYEYTSHINTKKETEIVLKNDEDKDLLVIKNDCKNNIELKKKEYDKFINYKDYDSAVRALEKCSEILSDNQLKKLVNEAQSQSYMISIEDKKTTDRARFFYINQLYIVNPELANKYEKIANDLQKKIYEEDEKEHKEYQRNNQWKEKYNIRIGDTKNQINKKWGEPKDIRYNVSQYGSLEIWVYDDITFTFLDNKLTQMSY